MTIDFDLTFLLQMVVFSGLIVLLQPLLFRPVLAIIEERERRTEGARGSAREMQEKAGELQARYERELARVREVAAREREAVRAETAKIEAEMLASARASAATILEVGRKRIERERDRAARALGQQSKELARVVAEAVLGRSVH